MDELHAARVKILTDWNGDTTAYLRDAQKRLEESRRPIWQGKQNTTSCTEAALANPYSPPEMQNHIAAKSMVSTINGFLIGIGVGLLTCDFLDLSPSDYTPLYGWRNGLIFFGLLGTAVGYARSDVLAWRWLILLGFVNLSIGSTVGFTTFEESPINVYTATMISVGFCYILLGTLVAIRHRRA